MTRLEWFRVDPVTITSLIHRAPAGPLLARRQCAGPEEAYRWCEQQLCSWSLPIEPRLPPPPARPLTRPPLSDWRFLASLKEFSPYLRELATELLAKVRKEFRGELQYHRVSGRWVESPDNFWTIKVQPEDRTVRITMRADGKKLYVPADIRLSADRPSYTAFKIRRESQVSSAFLLIQQAANNRRDDYFYGS